MKNFTHSVSGLLLLCFLTTTVCAEVGNAQYARLDSDVAILEYSVSISAVYSSWCKNAVHTRLFRDGRLEIEGCVEKPDSTEAGKPSRYKYVVEKNEYLLTSEEVRELVGLMESADFQQAERTYSNAGPDYRVEVKIIYRNMKTEKYIDLINVLPGTNGEMLPVSVSKLFLRIKEIAEAKRNGLAPAGNTKN
jgi:hypothetical protein